MDYINNSDESNYPSRKDLDEWREHILTRDDVCVVCGDDKKLIVHHIFPYGLYPQLRDDVSNGVVLCKYCHNKYHMHYGRKVNCNPITLIYFINKFGCKPTHLNTKQRGMENSEVKEDLNIKPLTKKDIHPYQYHKWVVKVVDFLNNYSGHLCPKKVLVSEFGNEIISFMDVLANQGIVYKPNDYLYGLSADYREEIHVYRR